MPTGTKWTPPLPEPNKVIVLNPDDIWLFDLVEISQIARNEFRRPSVSRAYHDLVGLMGRIGDDRELGFRKQYPITECIVRLIATCNYNALREDVQKSSFIAQVGALCMLLDVKDYPAAYKKIEELQQMRGALSRMFDAHNVAPGEWTRPCPCGAHKEAAPLLGRPV